MTVQGYIDAEDCDLTAFKALVERTTDKITLRFAKEVVSNVPIYCADDIPLTGPERQPLMAEWAEILRNGSGIVVIRNCYGNPDVLDRATRIYEDIIASEKAAGASNADHFAAGTNDRVWNSLQKLCLADPSVFADVFGNPALDTMCEAWLGPGYQMTAQVNVVHPGGAPQQAHRDYHLGFMTAEQAARFPAHVHDLSPVLTLQGAIAHCDMPIESGPTKLLPFSQTYREGYAAWRLPEFRAYFEEHYIQLPLKKGDMLFFSPALFHAAGENRTSDIHRFANLVQINSALGCPMETIDRTAMCKALYPILATGNYGPEATRAAIASCAWGYPFPTNLDTDPPVGGLAPQTQAELFTQALADGLSDAEFSDALDAQNAKRSA